MRFDEYDGVAGVYVLNFEDGSSYIGQSRNIGQRLRCHALIARISATTAIETIPCRHFRRRLRLEFDEIVKRAPCLNKSVQRPTTRRMGRGKPPGQCKSGDRVSMILSREALANLEAYRLRMSLASRTAAVERLAAEARDAV